jgi:hypothetical protein
MDVECRDAADPGAAQSTPAMEPRLTKSNKPDSRIHAHFNSLLNERGIRWTHEV